MATREEQDRLIVDSAKSRNEIAMGCDGSFYWWPNVATTGEGYFGMWHLRAIADELERLNKPWNEIIERELGSLASGKE
jgi:hypothetical protein